MSAQNSLKSALQNTTALIAGAFLLTQGATQAEAVTVNTPGSGAINLGSLQSLLVTSAGEITGTIFGANVLLDGGVLTSSITNNGIIGTGDSGGTVGILIESGSTLFGSITNNGDILGGTAGGTGIFLDSGSTVSGLLNNSGSITGDDYGIRIESGSEIAGGITNTSSGVISAADLSSNTATVYAIYLWGGASVGAISNDGTISADANAFDDSTADAYAYGIYANSGSTIASINNTGDITATATAESTTSYANATAYGIYLNTSSDITGAVSNDGTISATATSITDSTDSSADARAYAIYLNGSSTIDSLDNSGDITATATATSNDSTSANATAYAIFLTNGSDITGELNNSGTIAAIADANASTSDATADAYAIYLNNSSTIGSLDNTGDITATATADSSTDSASAFAAGIYLIGGSDITGALSNDGTISATATATSVTDDASATAYGIYLNSGSSIDSIDNTGEITASATADTTSDDADATARGIYLNSGSDITGELNNSGTISATAASNASIVSATASAAGIYLNNGSTIGSLENSGDITATATADSPSDSASATAYGIYLNDSDITGALTNTNTGTISAAATATANDSGTTSSSANASAAGIYLTGSPTTGSTIGSIDNAGEITATATVDASSASANATAFGIYLNNSAITGALNNADTGVISATADATTTDTSSGADAFAVGVYLTGSTGSTIGSINNEGEITATATAEALDDAADATAYGINLDNGSSIGGNLDNSATIHAEATATAQDFASAVAAGIRLENSSIGGDLINSSGLTISAEATADSTSSNANATAYGIYLNNSDVSGDIDNSGTITATADATADGTSNEAAYGLYLTGASTDIGGIINSGTIEVDSADGAAIFVGNINSLTNGIFNDGGTIKNDSGNAIFMDGLTTTIGIEIAGGTITGDVIDDDYAGGFSQVTISDDFATNGNFQVSDLTVDAGKTLTISSGDNITLNDMSVSGAGSTLNFGVANNKTFGSVDVTGGNVDLTNLDVTVGLAPGYAISDGDTMEIMNGVGAITSGPGGTPDAVAGDNSMLWGFSIVDGTFDGLSNNSDLYLITNFALADEIANTPNNKAVAGAIGAIIGDPVDGDLQDIFDALDAAGDAGAANDILASLQPADLNGAAQASILDLGTQGSNVIQDEVIALRSGDATSGMAAGASANGASMWLQGYGQAANQDDRGGIKGYDADTRGIAAGADTTNLFNDGALGIAFNYGKINADSDDANTTNTDIKSYGATIYGSRNLPREMFLDAQAGYAYNDIETERHDVGFPGMTASADYSSDQYSAKIAVGRDFLANNAAKMVFTPTFSAAYTYLRTDGYTETGTGGGLEVGDQNFDVLKLGIGANAAWTLKNANGNTLKPEIRAGYAYNAINDKVEITSSFVGDPSGTTFNASGPSPARNTFNGGVGLTFTTNANWDLSANYDYTFKTDYDSHAGTVRATAHF
jgi:outer membrane autotransporter protein